MQYALHTGCHEAQSQGFKSPLNSGLLYDWDKTQ